MIYTYVVFFADEQNVQFTKETFAYDCLVLKFSQFSYNVQ